MCAIPASRPSRMKVTSKSSTVKSNGCRSLGVEERAGAEVVVLAQGVGEPVLGHHDHAALEPEEPADREADQHDQHREVEQQVARLAQVAPLRGHGRPSEPVDHAGSASSSTTPRRCSSSVASAVEPSPVVELVETTSRCSGSRERFFGAFGGCARTPRQYTRSRGRSSPPARSSAGCRSRRTTPSRRPRTGRASRRSASARGAGRATGRRAPSRPPPAAPPTRGSRRARAGTAGSAPCASR